MKRLAVAFAIVFALNLLGSIISLSVPVSNAQEEPKPEPKEPDKD